MDRLDAKLVNERDRIVQQLTAIAAGLQALPPERLADVLPLVPRVDGLAALLRRASIAVAGSNSNGDRADYTL